jgi:hypothetical protein
LLVDLTGSLKTKEITSTSSPNESKRESVIDHTTAIVAVLYFGGNIERGRSSMRIKIKIS